MQLVSPGHAKNRLAPATPQPARDLARLVYGHGAADLDVRAQWTGRTLTLSLRGRIVSGDAAGLFGRLVRFAMCLPIVNRQAVLQLEAVRDIDFAGCSHLVNALLKADGATPLTVILPRTLLPQRWLRALATLTSPRTRLEQETGPTVTLQFGRGAVQ